MILLVRLKGGRRVRFKSNHFEKSMKTWTEALRHGVISGGVTSIATTVVLSKRGKQENGTPYAPTNAISHWIWGDRAARQDHPSVRYTLPGYAIHHASATLWAVLYEKWFGNKAEERSVIPALAGAAAVAALSCLVDYQVTPRRLHPGYEMRLSTRSLLLLYGTVGVALVLRGLISGKHRTSHGSSGENKRSSRNSPSDNTLTSPYRAISTHS